MRQATGLGLAVAFLALAACEQGQDPTTFGNGLGPVFVTTSPITPAPGIGSVYVCKVGPTSAEVTYSNPTSNVQIEVGSNPFSVAPGAANCVLVATADVNFPDINEAITLTESDPGTDAHFVQVDVFKFSGPTQVDQIVTAGNNPTVTVGGGPPNVLGNDIRFVVVYTNEADPTDDGCTRTIGYWKTHAGFNGNNADEVTPHLPVSLGALNTITTAQEAVDALSFYGKASNGINKLYGQLLAAKLNILSGADDSAIAGTITAAESFLDTHDSSSWNGLSKAEKQMVLGWVELLDGYNNGFTGPGHCD